MAVPSRRGREPRPRGSPKIRRSGGLSQPVGQGESARAIQPEGAMRKAMPKAAAACGTARKGASQWRNLAKDLVPDQPAMMSVAEAREIRAARRPVQNERATERPIPGQFPTAPQTSEACIALSSPGTWPSAPATTPIIPARTGPPTTRTVSQRKRREGDRVMPVSPRASRSESSRAKGLRHSGAASPRRCGSSSRGAARAGQSQARRG